MAVPRGDALEFSREIVRAKTFLEQGRIESCLEILAGIAKKYKEGSYFVDLLGDAYLDKGDIHKGARYKTLFEILRKILDTIDSEFLAPSKKNDHESSVPKRPFLQPCSHTSPSSLMDLESTPDAEEPGFISPEVMPVTLAIGKQYLAQGHLDLAIAVFEKLREQNPTDLEIQNLLTEAHTDKRRATVLRILQGWLKQVEKLKTQRKSFG